MLWKSYCTFPCSQKTKLELIVEPVQHTFSQPMPSKWLVLFDLPNRSFISLCFLMFADFMNPEVIALISDE
jgi:hypothetical protein